MFVRVSGPDPGHGSYRSFDDPDGDGWLFQEVTVRLLGRLCPGGHQDENWPDWYAEYVVREQAGSCRYERWLDGTGVPTSDAGRNRSSACRPFALADQSSIE